MLGGRKTDEGSMVIKDETFNAFLKAPYLVIIQRNLGVLRREAYTLDFQRRGTGPGSH